MWFLVWSDTFLNLRSGDCYDVSPSSYCSSLNDTCTIFAPTTTVVSNCNNRRADYFHIRYRCIPGNLKTFILRWVKIIFIFKVSSNIIRFYDVCDTRLTQGLFETSAFLRSPNYPKYTVVPNDCVVKIVAPALKIIRVWAAINMKYADLNDQYEYFTFFFFNNFLFWSYNQMYNWLCINNWLGWRL